MNNIGDDLNNAYSDGFIDGYKQGKKDVQRMGKWIKGGEQPYFRKHFDIVVCSVCNKRGERRWNYCPNCGSKMEV